MSRYVQSRELALAWPGRRPSGAFAGIKAGLTPRSPHVLKEDINQPDDQAKKGQMEPVCNLSYKVIWESFKE